MLKILFDCCVLTVLKTLLLSPPLARVWTPRVKSSVDYFNFDNGRDHSVYYRRIILDEIHTIGQQEGGSVWEEIILMAPCPIMCAGVFPFSCHLLIIDEVGSPLRLGRLKTSAGGLNLYRRRIVLNSEPSCIPTVIPIYESFTMQWTRDPCQNSKVWISIKRRDAADSCIRSRYCRSGLAPCLRIWR